MKHGSSRSYVFPEDDAHEGDDSEDVEHAPETELLAQHGTDKLCILVAASRSCLPQAMSSALYHRRACGVLDPVVGLVVNPDSATVEFAVGWLDTSGSGNELVTHLSFLASTCAEPCDCSRLSISPGAWPTYVAHAVPSSLQT